ncbi:MAG: RraA family protein [Planctomycetota bacterium]|jgi:regulator of RNase E activity RraA|nr:RraA family protein [Planctomycetota bacterium]
MERLTSSQLEEIKQFDCPTVCNAIECFGVRPRNDGFALPGMTPRTLVDERLLGYAATAKISALHPPKADAAIKLIEYYTLVRETAKPTVAVIQDIDPQPVGSFWGEVQATVHQALGAVGTLTHGGVRDLDEAGKNGFHFFSTRVLISHGFVQVVEQGCGVEINGLRVRPGELVFADKHGVVLIPDEVAPRLAEACREVAAAELPMLTPCREAIKNGVPPSIDEIKQWREGMAKARNIAAEKFKIK